MSCQPYEYIRSSSKYGHALPPLRKEMREMRVPWPTLLRLLHAAALLLYAGIATAGSNFLQVRLPKGVTVELPKNWTALSNNQRITLDSYVQAKRELVGAVDPVSDLNFAANYYDDQGKTAAMFNIRYYPEMTLTQAESRSVSAADTKELDDTLRAGMTETQQQFGMRIISWMGTTKQTIKGTVAFVTEYRRASIRDGAPFRVRLVRVLNASRSFTVTISYREDQEIFLRPICDRVIQSIRI